MSDGLADTDGPATATTSMTDWLSGQGQSLGRSYVNELERHFDIDRIKNDPPGRHKWK
jgi:hypothetical protein